ncbi:MAG TPA: molybdopterin-dependent oxidoreductase, partial [Limnochordia bacterium]
MDIFGPLFRDRKSQESLVKDNERLVATHCCFCGMQCGLYLRVDPEANRVKGVEPRYGFPVNEGRLCPKGVVSYQTIHHPDRVLRPLIKGKDGRFRETGWDEALARVAAGIRGIQRRYGKEAMAVLSGSSLTNEKCYVAGKFARVALGTPHIDYNGRLCMSSAGAANMKAFGMDRMANPWTDVLYADCLLIAGSNTTECHPTGITYIWRAMDRGAKLIVVDPR